MGSRSGSVGLLCLAVGAVILILSTAAYTGITGPDALGSLAAVGFSLLLLAVGAVLVGLDRRHMKWEVQDYEETVEYRKLLTAAGEDGYVADLDIFNRSKQKKKTDDRLLLTLDACTELRHGFLFRSAAGDGRADQAEAGRCRKLLAAVPEDGYAVALCLQEHPADETELAVLDQRPVAANGFV